LKLKSTLFIKKIKLMLLGIVVVASVGSALAFKAVKGQQLFCGPTRLVCPNFTIKYKFTTVNPLSQTFCSTVPHNGEGPCIEVTNNQ